MSSYLVFHHGTWWFRIRVPARLVGQHGPYIRQNLQTRDWSVARALALKLASEWLVRFSCPVSGPAYDTGATCTPPPSPDVVTPEQEHSSGPCRLSVASDENGLPKLIPYWSSLNQTLAASSVREYKAVAQSFQRQVAKPYTALDRTDVVRYRDHLLARGYARATVAKHMSIVSSLLQTAVDAGLLQHNVARGLRIPKPKVDALSRRSFTNEELRQIFSSPVYALGLRPRGGCGEAAAWVPAIAYATGARLVEICQLRVADVRSDSRHGPVLLFTDEAEGQRLKTTSSRREVPVHPALIQAGLLEYVTTVADARHEWLFPLIEPDHDGRRGGSFSQWFTRYLRSDTGCGIKDKRVVFHSFRHTFKTLCREAGISEEIHDALTGHAGKTVGRAYGTVPLVTLVSAVSRMSLPVPIPRITR